jgi:trafficking protein particle complex subunit 11
MYGVPSSLLHQTLISPTVRTSVQFWEADVYVDQPATFQLAISMPRNIALSSLSFVSVSIFFSDDVLAPLVIHHSDDAPDSDKKVRRVVLGDVSRYLFDNRPVEVENLQSYLRWGSGVSIVFMGTLQLDVPGILKLTKVILTVKHNNWWIELPIKLNELQNYGGRTLETPKWLTSVDPPQYVPVKRGDCTTATYVNDWQCFGKP